MGSPLQLVGLGIFESTGRTEGHGKNRNVIKGAKELAVEERR
jgi:hypothetical protein